MLRPILSANFDFVAPYYHRHKYDGTITNSIVYPLTRALYGMRVRQPIGGEFGISARLIARYLERDDWETDVARYGIDIWMTTIAMAEGFRVCQSFLGAKLHDAKDPSSDLSAMLQQVVGSVFLLMKEYEGVWRERHGSQPVAVWIPVRRRAGPDRCQRRAHGQRLLPRLPGSGRSLVHGAPAGDICAGYRSLANTACSGGKEFRLEDDLWARVILDFACAFKKHPLLSRQLVQSLTPLYLGRVASFVQQTQNLGSVRVEEEIEKLCLTFESLKPYLLNQWVNGSSGHGDIPSLSRSGASGTRNKLEV